jgi:hypothetical protein
MGNYFSSIKVDDAANVTNATNDAEHDDVLVLSTKSVDPLEIKNDEKNLLTNINKCYNMLYNLIDYLRYFINYLYCISLS